MTPPPLQSSLMLDQGGVITSPPWRKWFSQLLLPAVQQAQDAEITGLAQALSKGTLPGGGADSDLSIAAFIPRAAAAANDEFPPVSERSRDTSDLAMLAASQFARQQLPWVVSDTQANRANYPNSTFPMDTLFVATDWLVTYRNTGAAWRYVSGTYAAALASIPTLGTNDAGFLFAVTDYAHLLRWSGTTWSFAPGDGGSGMLALFEVDPGTGWHLYDGSTVNYLKADGTTGSVTLPDLAGTAAYLKAGSPNGGPNAAVAPGLAMNSFTPAGTVSSTFFGSVQNFTTALFVATAGAVAALISPTSIVPAGAVGSTFTGTPAVPTGTVDNTGQPRNLVRRPFFRQ